MARLMILLTGVCFLYACSKDRLIGPQMGPRQFVDSNAAQNVLLIGCEGNFQVGNASITRYQRELDKVEQDVYRSQNNQALGDVLQSLYHDEQRVYAVVNNSGMIRVLADSSLKEIGVIGELNSPRYLCQVSAQIWAVSDFGGGEIALVNTQSLEVIDRVAAPKWTEHMVFIDSLLWVADMTDSALVAIDLKDRAVVIRHELFAEPRQVIETDKGLLAVCRKENQSLVYQLEEGGLSLLLSSTIKAASAGFYSSYLYVLTDSRVELINELGEMVGGFKHEAKTPYGVYIDTSGIYISDAGDYVGAGEVLWYNHQFELLKHIPAGVIPQCMLSF
jgi:hypothetical protein